MILASLKDLVREKTADVLKSQAPGVGVPDFDLAVPPPKIPGDLAANVALMVAKEAKKSPRDVAAALMAAFQGHPWVGRTETAGAGFVNFWLTDAAYKAELESLLTPSSAARSSRGDMLIEFVSANPTGPLHVGHGRGAALGDSLVRIFRHLGHRVHAEFYVNDSGGQIRKLGLSVEARWREGAGEAVTFPEDGYKGSYVKDLADEIRSKGLALKPVTPAQMVFGEDDFAGYASGKLLTRIQETLASFGVTFDQWYRESSLHKSDKVAATIRLLRDKGLAYDADGATWFKATEFGDEKDRVLQKANEAPTYFASDIAYHLDKFARGPGMCVDIWGADHHGYAQRVKGALAALGQDPARLHVVFNQMISVKGSRMSKRSGDMVTLQEVVDDVGRDATRFFFALRSPGAHFEFDLDLAKKQASDNPVFYVQYVHARCASIFREAEKRGLPADVTAWKTAGHDTPVHESEKAVLLHLMSFERTVEMCARDFSNHHLTVYLMELAAKFHSFYEHCPVLSEGAASRSFRLAVVEAIRRRVAEGLNLLGVGAPETL